LLGGLSLLLHVDVAVDVRSDGIGRVPEHLLHNLDVLATCNERRGGAVPQCVNGDAGDLGPFGDVDDCP
jgi:hypothetical protein